MASVSNFIVDPFCVVFRDYLNWSGWKHLGSFSQIIMVPIFSKWPSGHLGSFILWLFWLQAWHILTNRDARCAHDPPIRGQYWVSTGSAVTNQRPGAVDRWPADLHPGLQFWQIRWHSQFVLRLTLATLACLWTRGPSVRHSHTGSQHLFVTTLNCRLM